MIQSLNKLLLIVYIHFISLQNNQCEIKNKVTYMFVYGAFKDSLIYFIKIRQFGCIKSVTITEGV